MTDNQEMRTEEQVDEVELIDYISVLCKWKKLVIIGTLSCMLIAGIVSFILPPVYLVSAVIEIGIIERKGGDSLMVNDPIETSATLVEKIKRGVYDDEIQKKLNIKQNDYPEIKVKNPKDTSLIEIIIESSNKKRALHILQTMNELILKKHLELIGILKFNITNKIQEIENNINLLKMEKESIKQQLKLILRNREQLKKQLGGIASRISELEREKAKMDRKANPDNTLGLLLFSNEIQENRRFYYKLQDRLNISLEKEEVNQKYNLNAKEKNIKSLFLGKDRLNERLKAFRDTRVVKNASIHTKPVKPKKILNITVAVALGFVLAVFIAFFMEYLLGIKKLKLRESTS